MSSMLTKNFHLCFSKIKCLPISSSPPLTLDDEEDHHHHEDNSIYEEEVLLTATSASDPPNFSTAFASHRFFVSSPGQSNSILDSSPSSSSSSSSSFSPRPDTDPHRLVGGGVAIRKYSPDPFSDFRKSMQEMIEASKEKLEGTATKRISDDWEYLHQLLLCYLSLNPKHTHKFIIGAFADLLVSLMDD